MKIKTSELTGRALDWAVAVAIGQDIGTELFGREWNVTGSVAWANYWHPSIDWEHGGPLIERFQLDIWHRVEEAEGNDWHASCRVPFERFQRAGYEEDEDGPTPLIAAMRAIVAAKLGDEVDVEEEVGKL